MKIFRAEYLNDYGHYTFSYATYALMESPDDISGIYNGGFLPYSAKIDLKYPVFYLARSLRIDLNKFADSSENRRVDRKLNGMNPVIERYNINDFDTKDEAFLNFCMDYASERFSGNAMNRKRFEYILNAGIATDIFRFYNPDDSRLLGYVLAVVNDDIFHYWFSFFDTRYLQNFPLGKWMMWRMIKWSKENNLKYIFLGTGYGNKSLYKIRDFKGIEFFDGNFWNPDISILKSLCKSDHNKRDTDLFKLTGKPNEFLQQIIFKIKN